MFKFVPLSATINTLTAHLYPDERVILHRDGVGLYDGKDKDAKREEGRVFLTSHRLLYLDTLRPHISSTALSLSLIRQTEYWAGFLKSSPKVTLLLGDPVPSTSSSAAAAPKASSGDDLAERNWVCRVCGMKNLPSAILGAKCGLCGVARDPTATTSAPASRSATPVGGGYRPSSRAEPPPPAPPPPPPTADTDPRVPCPICTFLNHRSMASCELCDSPLPSIPSARSSTTLASTQSSTPLPSSSSAADPFVRLSFRKGGEKAFYAQLKSALEAKEWDLDRVGKGRGRREEESGAGIDGILRGIDMDAKEREDSLEDALKDLDALMANAKEMIQLAQTLNDRLTAAESTSSSSPASASDTQLIRGSLAQIGLVGGAVTQDMLKDEKRYRELLTKELSGILARPGGIMKDGLVGLDEVWCVWNRARGVSLISPTDLKLTAPFLESHASPPIHLRTFRSGLTVLHTPHFRLPAFSARLLELLDLRQALAASSVEGWEGGGAGEREGATTLEVAQVEGIALLLAREMVEGIEEGGEVVRDEQGGEGVRWYRNYISLQGAGA